jgi:hypothetical protein
MFTRENGCEKATRRDSKKRCTDHSFSWDIISLYKKKGKARRRQSARVRENKRKTMRKTYSKKKNIWTMGALGQRVFFFLFF